MTKNSLVSILNRMNVPLNTWTRLDSVYQIIMSGDANIFAFDSAGAMNEENKYYFDTDNELLFIKKFTSKKLASSRFNDKCKFKNSTIEYGEDDFFKSRVYPGLIYQGRKIKNPEMNDLIFTVNKNTLKQEASTTVSDVVRKDGKIIVQLEKAIDMSGKIVCWAKDPVYNRSEVDPKDESLLWFSEEITERDFDSVVTFDIISGISMNRVFVSEE